LDLSTSKRAKTRHPAGSGLKIANLPEASSIIKHLFTIDAGLRPRVQRVRFRKPDGSIGRRDFATHWIHWYPAKMFHWIPRIIMDSLSKQSKLLIFDPFCGSGTVLLEAILKGHQAVGCDVNPIARLISQVKTNVLDPQHLNRHAASIILRARRNASSAEPDEILDFWFKPEIRSVLQALFKSIQYVNHPQCRDFFTVVFSSVVRRSSLADPSMPPPVKLSLTRIKKANRKYKIDLKRARALEPEHVYDYFRLAIEKNIQRMRELKATPRRGRARILPAGHEASRTGLKDECVDLVVTSPPYCGAQKYVRSLRLEMLLIGILPEEIVSADRMTLGTERILKSDVEKNHTTRLPSANRLIEQIRSRNPVRACMLACYINYLDEFAIELGRVLKSGGNAFVTFGTDHISGIEVDCASIFVKVAATYGLRHIATLVDSIPSRGLMTTRHATAGTINDERVVWLRK